VNEKSLGRDWAIEAQKLLLSLRDIVGADIRLADDGLGLAEINILAEGNRPPKQIVRDVRSALRAEYQVDVDYRKISVAQRRDVEGDLPGYPGEVGGGLLTLPAGQVDEEPVTTRLRFEGVSVQILPADCRVRVELSLDDRETVGESLGSNSNRQLPLLVAEATLEAVAKFLDPDCALALADLQVVSLGGESVVLVLVRLHKDRSEKVLTGSAPVGATLQQSVVYATLNALNRALGRLRFREPVEYELRPTSSF
jgi:hypothetical protein